MKKLELRKDTLMLKHDTMELEKLRLKSQNF